MHWRPYQQLAGHFASGHYRWASRSVDEAIETLASPDVTVTNQSDKELQLYKLRELDSLVQEAVAQCAREAVDPTVVEIAPPSRG